MNLFRSEEHAKEWSRYDPMSEESIMPVTDWAYVMGAEVFRKRLEPDYFDRMDENWEDFFARLAEFGRIGSYWK
jgi:hypothetical protein